MKELKCSYKDTLQDFNNSILGHLLFPEVA